MADFTITTTITGTVNGRALSNTHTYTVEDVIDVIEDGGVVNGHETLSTFVISEGRGYHKQNAPAFACIAPLANGNGLLNINMGGVADAIVDMTAAVPLVYHHGEGWNGSGSASAGGTILDPDQDAIAFTIRARTAFEFRSIGLFKPVS